MAGSRGSERPSSASSSTSHDGGDGVLSSLMSAPAAAVVDSGTDSGVGTPRTVRGRSVVRSTSRFRRSRSSSSVVIRGTSVGVGGCGHRGRDAMGKVPAPKAPNSGREAAGKFSGFSAVDVSRVEKLESGVDSLHESLRAVMGGLEAVTVQLARMESSRGHLSSPARGPNRATSGRLPKVADLPKVIEETRSVNEAALWCDVGSKAARVLDQVVEASVSGRGLSDEHVSALVEVVTETFLTSRTRVGTLVVADRLGWGVASHYQQVSQESQDLEVFLEATDVYDPRALVDIRI